jgi:tetratricopeptide (TPR) repeat protein
MALGHEPEALERRIREYEALLRDTLPARDDAATRRAGQALLGIGGALARLGRFEEAAERLAEADATLWLLPSTRGAAVVARVQRATALGALGRYEAALEILDDVIGLGGEVSAAPDLIVDALWGRAVFLRHLGRADEAYVAAEGLIQQIRFDSGEHRRLLLTRALLAQAELAPSLGQADLALPAVEEAISRCSGESSLKFRKLLADGLIARASLLEQAGQAEEALAAYEMLVKRFAQTPEADLRLKVEEALKNKARMTTGAKRARIRRLRKP